MTYDLDTQRHFITTMVYNAIDGLDGTKFAMSNRQKANALKVLTVKKPNGGKGNCSSAGWSTIIINLSYWQIKNVQNGKYENGYKCFENKVLDGHVYWNEYKSFDANPKCGGMFVATGDVYHGNTIQVLHEVSHYVQHTLYKSDRTKWAWMRKPHGEGFIRIYSILREKFCNDPSIRAMFIETCKDQEFMDWSSNLLEAA